MLRVVREHLVAVSNGGGNDPENTVACCQQEIAALLAKLQAQGIISIDGTKVTYA